METKAFPRAGINHPVAKIAQYRRMMVSQEEYDLIIEHRKCKMEVLRPGCTGDCLHCARRCL